MNLPISDSESVISFLFLDPFLGRGLAVADFLGTTFGAEAGVACFLGAAAAATATEYYV